MSEFNELEYYKRLSREAFKRNTNNPYYRKFKGITEEQYNKNWFRYYGALMRQIGSKFKGLTGADKYRYASSYQTYRKANKTILEENYGEFYDVEEVMFISRITPFVEAHDLTNTLNEYVEGNITREQMIKAIEDVKTSAEYLNGNGSERGSNKITTEDINFAYNN